MIRKGLSGFFLMTILMLAVPFMGQAAGPFRIVKDEAGKYWFEGPDGRFLSMGVNHISDASFNAPAGSQYYDARNQIFGGSMEKWRASVFEIMKSAGMDTIGAWSDPKLNDGTMHETPILYVASHAKERVISGLLPDFEDKVRANTRAVVGELADTSGVIGVFLDNEMAWYGSTPWDPNPTYTILEEVMNRPVENAEREAAVAFLKERYGSAAKMAAEWKLEGLTDWTALSADLLRRSRTPSAMAAREEFLTRCANAFYERSCRVVREELPGMLILGTRFAGNAPDAVIKACGAHCDVVSFNNYRPVPEADEVLLARYWLLGGKPLMITEYSWRARENSSGNRNSRGAGTVVATQADRAASYTAFVEATLSYPMVVGMHWFEWADQSPQGRFDGEDSNYGIVDIRNRPYAELVAAMNRTNTVVVSIHASSPQGAPTRMPDPPKVIVEPGQFPDRPSVVDLLKEDPVRAHEVFNAADASVLVTGEQGGVLVLEMDTGIEWGCGISLHGPARTARAGIKGEAVDLDGYSTIVVEGVFPPDQQFQLIMDEAGVAAPGAASYDSGAGDDGESFAFEPVVTSGGKQSFRFALKDLQTRTVWGNQTGGRRVDLAALKGLAIAFPGGGGKVTVKLHSVRLEK